MQSASTPLRQLGYRVPKKFLENKSMNEKLKRRAQLDEYDDMLSVKDLCEFLKISPTTAYTFIKETPLVVVRVGREYKVSRKSLAEYFHLDI